MRRLSTIALIVFLIPLWHCSSSGRRVPVGCSVHMGKGSAPDEVCKPELGAPGFAKGQSSQSDCKALEEARDQWEANALQAHGLAYKWDDANDREFSCDDVTCPATANDPCVMCTVTARPCLPWNVQETVAMLSYKGNVLTAFESGGIYLSPDGLSLGGGDNTIAAYPGPQKVTSMISYQGKVITAFEGGGIYSSTDGKNPGGGHNAIAVYPGTLKVVKMISHQAQAPPEPPVVITAFENGSIYRSPDGLHLGGGGKTIAVYSGPLKVIAMISHQGPRTQRRVITAFEGGGIYSSPDGFNLGGGGSTTAVYPGTQRVLAMISYQGSVITAFENGSIYSSTTGSDLGGGGSTTSVYPGPLKVTSMIAHQGTSALPVVITAFESGGIYSSPTGFDLGGGGTTTAVYQGTEKVRLMISHATTVLTAFEGGSIYSSPNGQHLGGGGSTPRVYPPF